VALSKEVGGGRWSVRAQLRPFVDWVWLSAVMMALGGVLAVSDRRYRARAAASEPAVAQGSAAEAT
jgi:cytochrome c-type biogenesis protein CcmF